MPTEEIDLQLFSLSARVRTDVPEVARYTQDLFRRFVVAPGAANADRKVNYTLSIMSAPTDPGSWCIADGELDADVDRAEWLTGIVAARLLEIVGNRVQDHDLFHAAALQWVHGAAADESTHSGLMICGESGFGKSTLALALLDHGFSFLSDEVGAVDRAGRLIPFPKALEMRPGDALQLPAGGTPGRFGKTLYDVENLRPGCVGSACRLSTVVFLEGSEAAGGLSKATPGEITVTLHRRVAAIPDALAAVPGIESAVWAVGESTEGPVDLDIRFDPTRFAPWTLPGAIARHGALIVSSSAESAPPRDFTGEPVLTQISGADAVRRLLGQFRGTAALANRIGSDGAEFGDVFVDMLRRFDDVRFVRLRVGRLDAMVQRLHELTATV